jgi:diguanylate cyclase (GGDEF)-like protein
MNFTIQMPGRSLTRLDDNFVLIPLFSVSLSITSSLPPKESNSDWGAPVSGCGEYEDVLAQGFKALRFPPALEARYSKDKENERLRLIHMGTILLGAMNCVLLLPDWFMVPDQMGAALAFRLLVLMPFLVTALFFLKYLNPAARETVAQILGLMVAGISCYLSVLSKDPLAPDYLVSLFAAILFNGGVMRMRFWMAVASAVMVLAMFVAGACLVPNPPVAVLLSAAVVMISSAVFALFSSYRSEHEDRANWLVSQQQALLREEVIQGNQQLDRLSRFDPLTDVANRRHFDEFLSQVWSRAQHDGEDVALLMIDIDHFKRYNDHYGHAQGDVCIQAVAKALRGHLRQPEDLIARYGGEEFVAVLPGADIARAGAVAEQMRRGVADLKLPHEASPGPAHVTLSIGVACMRANGAHASPERLLASADAALYRAKAGGRDTVVLSDQRDAMATSPTSKLAMTASAAMTVSGPPDAARDELEKASDGIERAWSPLRFPVQLERQFELDGARARLKYFAIAAVIAFVIFNGFLLTDYLLAGDVFWLAVKVRMGFFAPFGLALLSLLSIGREWILRTWSTRMKEGVIVLSGVLAAASLGYITSASQLATSQLYHAGLAVVIAYGNLVQRLRFRYAVVFSALVVAIHIMGLLTLPTYNPRLTVPLLAMILASAVFTLMANHALERDERRLYLLRLSQQYVLKQLEDVRLRLQTMSRIDALTGMFNRRHFHDYVQQVWQRAQHGCEDVAIIMLDVDHFKLFNDRYGHQAGDDCLVMVAQAMKACLRQPGDMVARFGGEEFIAVLPQTDLVVAQAIAERVRQAVSALRIPHEASSAAAVVTVSVGVASWAVQSGQLAAELIKAADDALYRAKSDWRNRVMA